MSLLFLDSFDHYATADITEKYTASGGTVTVGATGGRYGNGARCSGTAAAYVLQAIAPIDGVTAIVGRAIRTPLTYAHQVIGFYDGVAASPQLLIRVNPDGSVSAVRYGTGAATSPLALGNTPVTLGSSVGGVIQANVWHYLEVKATIDNAAGVVVVRVDNTIVLSLPVAAEAIDTQATANAQVTAIAIGSLPTTSQNVDMDDVYICDVDGGVNDDFLGDVRVDAHLPSGAGTTSSWTPSTGSNYACVDEAAPNDDTDYVSTMTVDAVDTYAFANFANPGGSIYGLQVLAACKKADAGTCTVAPVDRKSVV